MTRHASTLRRIRTTASAFTVTATLVLGGCGVGDEPGANLQSQKPERQSPAAAPSVATTETTLAMTDEVGDGPGLAWRAGERWFDANGRPIRGARGARDVIELGSERLVSRVHTEDSATLQILSTDGTVLSTREVTSGPVVNKHHTVAAWVTADGALQVHAADAEATWGSWPGASLSMIGGDLTCGTQGVAGCAGYLQPYDASEVVRVDGSGGHSVRATEVATLMDVAEGSGKGDRQISAWVDDVKGSLCSRLFPGQTVYCGVRFGRFAPDGQHLVAAPQLTEPGPTTQLELWTATDPRAVVRIQAPVDGTIAASAWEDAEHVLILGGSGGRWQIWRVDLAGNVEAASRWRMGRGEDPAQALSGAELH